ncbi:peptide-methionine (S)-S-oxide reductase [Oceanisphaera pacifica]|uniref:peptide-methionine (S)-S-oxide reductase MsrA n=1 Tax=Oceanisphaera pacifica TaxID=2818389 RepID=UPI00311CB152
MLIKNIKPVLLSALLVFPLSVSAAQAVFAGGSFWVMEALFASRLGVTEVTAGWVKTDNRASRRQAVRVEYDAQQINYGELLTLYWAAIDPFDGKGQYCDRGREYSPAIYVQTAFQRRLAQQSRAQIALAQNNRVKTRILPANIFMQADERHQQYYQKHPVLYGGYRPMCGYPSERYINARLRARAPLATTAQ